MLKPMKRGFVILIVLVFICLGAGAWASAASFNVSQGAENGFVHLLANGLATLARIPANMTETGVLLCLGICLIVLAQLLQKVRQSR